MRTLVAICTLASVHAARFVEESLTELTQCPNGIARGKCVHGHHVGACYNTVSHPKVQCLGRTKTRTWTCPSSAKNKCKFASSLLEDHKADVKALTGLPSCPHGIASGKCKHGTHVGACYNSVSHPKIQCLGTYKTRTWTCPRSASNKCQFGSSLLEEEEAEVKSLTELPSCPGGIARGKCVHGHHVGACYNSISQPKVQCLGRHKTRTYTCPRSATNKCRFSSSLLEAEEAEVKSLTELNPCPDGIARGKCVHGHHVGACYNTVSQPKVQCLGRHKTSTYTCPRSAKKKCKFSSSLVELERKTCCGGNDYYIEGSVTVKTSKKGDAKAVIKACDGPNTIHVTYVDTDKHGTTRKAKDCKTEIVKSSLVELEEGPKTCCGGKRKPGDKVKVYSGGQKKTLTATIKLCESENSVGVYYDDKSDSKRHGFKCDKMENA